ncbi:MAG: AAA family ATPase [Bryobacteraceae bacterium]
MYISSFSIDGYRSLKGVKITNMTRVCIFHGPNNSGKSNILSALETIFQQKVLIDETTLEEVTKHERPGSFYQGRISNFRDNFFSNGRDDIKLEVSVTFADEELAFLTESLKAFHPSLAKPGHNKILTVTGRIKYVDDDAADMVLEKVVFNRSHIVFEESAGKKSFFPTLTKLSVEQRLAHFEKLMNMLANSFVVIPSDRYLTSETAVAEPNLNPLLTPKTFKNWLFKLYLKRSGYAAFEEIKNMFETPPFSIGEVSFSKERDEIDIMVQEKKVRLPIGRLGSGYQQVLYIIANLVLSKSKMMGIEELEINLSPALQRTIFEKLKKHIFEGGDLASQIIITSHSEYFSPHRTDVRCYGVEHNGAHTTVTPWTQSKRTDFFKRPARATR